MILIRTRLILTSGQSLPQCPLFKLNENSYDENVTDIITGLPYEPKKFTINHPDVDVSSLINTIAPL